MVLQTRGDYPAAEALLREALDVRRELLGEGHAMVIETGENLALLLLETGSYEDAESLSRASLSAKRSLLSNLRPADLSVPRTPLYGAAVNWHCCRRLLPILSGNDSPVPEMSTIQAK